MIRYLAHKQSLLLLSSPGVGKSEMVADTAVKAGLECRSLLGTEALQCPVQAGGLEWSGARNMSAEEIVVEMTRCGDTQTQAWDSCTGVSEVDPAPGSSSETALGEALREAGIVGETDDTQGAALPSLPQPDGDALDVLPASLEGQWFPHEDENARQRAAAEIRELSAGSVSLGIWHDRLGEGGEPRPGDSPYGGGEQLFSALRASYAIPWEVALSRWLEAAAPGPRTYARPSRRAGDRTDVVLPGRSREGWTIHVVLDTTGSMLDQLPRALGAIADYADAVQLEAVHVVQCSGEVVDDRWFSPMELSDVVIKGLGGGPLTPAMDRLAKDWTVEAVIVVTDGGEEIPEEPPPYKVLWVLTDENQWFVPRYGTARLMDPV